MTVAVGVRTAAAGAVAWVALSGCAALPTAPPPLPSTFVPEVAAPSPEPGIPVGDDGFTVVERVALRVTVETCDEYRNGSAWVLDENTAVTNRHVIEGAVDIELTSYDGQRYEGTASVLSDDVDLALVDIDGTFPEAAQLATAEPSTGDPVFVVGYPEAGRLTTTTGIYAGTVPDNSGVDGEGAFAIAADTKQGNSGSPTVDENGDVIGVVFASDESTTTIVVSLESLQTFLGDPSLQVPNEADCER
ncbi:trypsin-like peptidase domain-containing protein [Demequina sp. SO4-18]|uniref:trypsin-like peptidase domain-containing protein n=1 Tax=Demequina sp. SO4-18 TaxID=3401026 RepID=UPI003B5BC3D3